MVRRPVIVAPAPVLVDEYPVYAAPRVMRHLRCMRTPVRFGVTDGAIDVTSQPLVNLVRFSPPAFFR